MALECLGLAAQGMSCKLLTYCYYNWFLSGKALGDPPESGG